MELPIARITDMTICPMVTPDPIPIPHIGGPIVGSPAPVNVLAGFLPVARITDLAVCVSPIPPIIVEGSVTVLACDLPISRMGDMTDHGGVIMLGDFTVLVGE